jgi:hypothetical protein
MLPTRDSKTTLVDLLDRVLTKGLILDADVIIQVAGIPLLGLKLRAALAGIETMLNYGIWEDWDKAQRAVASIEYSQKSGPAKSSGALPGAGVAEVPIRAR